MVSNPDLSRSQVFNNLLPLNLAAGEVIESHGRQAVPSNNARQKNFSREETLSLQQRSDSILGKFMDITGVSEFEDPENISQKSISSAEIQQEMDISNSQQHLNQLADLARKVTGEPVYRGNTGENIYNTDVQAEPLTLTNNTEETGYAELLADNPQAYENYNNLSEEEKELFADIAGAASAPGTLNPDLVILLESGMLTGEVDGQDVTLLQNLSDMSTQEFASELNGQNILCQTLQHVARPESMKQGNIGTCTVAALQYLQAREHPADYVQTVAGLTGTEGQVDLGYGGDPIVVHEGSLESDQTGRDDVSRIYQATMMEYGNGEYWDYNNEDHQHVDPETGKPRGESGGLNTWEYERVASAVLPYDISTSYGSEDEAVWDMIEEEIQQSLDEGIPVAVALKWTYDDENETYSGHQLVIIDMDDEYVYLRNPWGDSERGSAGDGDSVRPDREAVPDENGNSGGVIRMRKDVFFEHLRNYHLSEEDNAPGIDFTKYPGNWKSLDD
jgi:uncharacterized protein YvpB